MLTKQKAKREEKSLAQEINIVPYDVATIFVAIADIICDPTAQPRAALSQEVVADYQEVLLEGGEFPPVGLKFDGEKYYLYDGFHRIEAAKKLKRSHILAGVSSGGLREAVLASLGANAEHGLRRSAEDKRKAVLTLLQDPEWKQWANSEIARHCKVSEGLVRKIKKEHPEYNVDSVKFRKNGQEQTMKRKKIETLHLKGEEATIIIDQRSPVSPGEIIIASSSNDNRLTPFLGEDSPTIKEGDIVQIKHNRSDERLIGHYGSYAFVAKPHPNSCDILLIGGERIFSVSYLDVVKTTGLISIASDQLSFLLKKLS